MRTPQFRLHALLVLGVTALLGACGSGGEATSGTGMVRLAITDAPVDDADAVWVQFSGVAFKREGAPAEFIATPVAATRRINLLDYQQGRVAVLLDNLPIEAGRYEWVRLMVDNEPNVRDSYVVVAGQECEMRIPSGNESGLKLMRGFTLPAAGSAALTIDFDLRQSLHAPPGQQGNAGACTQGYLLRPTLRLVDDANVGAIAGHVAFDAGTVPVSCLPKVYVYQGSVVPDDMEDTTAAATDVDPYVIASVQIPAGAVSGTYRVGFLPAGNYTTAFTCADDTNADETVTFLPSAGQPVTVQNNLVSTVDFAVPVMP